MTEPKNADLFQRLYGHPADEPEPAYYPVLKALGQDMGEAILKRSKEIIRQVTLEADKIGLVPYLQYVFFVLMERPREWPSMTKDRKEALHVLRSILSTSGDTPTYTDGLRMPPEVSEQHLDTALLQLAIWANTTFRVSLRKEYFALVRKHLPAFARMIPGVDEGTFGALFETSVRKRPMMFPKGHLLNQVFTVIP